MTDDERIILVLVWAVFMGSISLVLVRLLYLYWTDKL